MLHYRVTVFVDRGIEAEWLPWMLEEHIPEVMATGRFLASRVRRILEPEAAPGRTGYEIEYDCGSREDYEAYRKEDAPRLQEEHTERYRGRFEAERRVIEDAEPRAPR